MIRYIAKKGGQLIHLEAESEEEARRKVGEQADLYEYVPEKTAIHRVKPSAPCQFAYTTGLVIGQVLDWGCGRGSDLEWLTAKGFDCQGWDPVYQPDKPLGLFDYAQCLFVVNVLPDHEERIATLKEMVSYCRQGANVVVASRAHSEVEASAKGKSSWKRVGSGYVTSKGTYQEGFTKTELAALCRHAGLNVVNTIKRSGNTFAICKTR